MNESRRNQKEAEAARAWTTSRFGVDESTPTPGTPREVILAAEQIVRLPSKPTKSIRDDMNA